MESLALELAAEKYPRERDLSGKYAGQPALGKQPLQTICQNQGITEAEVRKKYEAQVPLDGAAVTKTLQIV